MGGGSIDKGVLACGKGNHDAGAWVPHVRVSAHTVWMLSSFPLLCKLQMNHMLLMPRSLQTHHSLLRCRSFQLHNSQMKCRSSLLRCRNFLKCHMFLGLHKLPTWHMLEVLCTSPVVQGLWWRLASVWWLVEAEGVAEEEDWYRHTGGIGTVAGTVDTVGTDASAGSTLSKTWSTC